MENKSFTTKGCPDDKYFSFKGKIVAKCPVCKNKMEIDFSDDHIEYINDYIGKTKKFWFWCNACEKEFTIPIKIKSVSYTVDLQFDISKLKPYKK